VTHYIKMPFRSKINGMSNKSFGKLEYLGKNNFYNLTVRRTLGIYNIKKGNKISFQWHLYINLVWLRHYETMAKLYHDFRLINLDAETFYLEH